MYTRVVQSVPSTPGRPVVMPGSGPMIYYYMITISDHY